MDYTGSKVDFNTSVIYSDGPYVLLSLRAHWSGIDAHPPLWALFSNLSFCVRVTPDA